MAGVRRDRCYVSRIRELGQNPSGRSPQASVGNVHLSPSKNMWQHRTFIVVLALTVLSTACSNNEEKKRSYREKGDAAFASKQYSEAALEYRNLLKLVSEALSPLYSIQHSVQRP